MEISQCIFSVGYLEDIIPIIYNLPSPVSVEFIRSGVNDTYIVESAGARYYFRLSRNNTINGINLIFFETEVKIWDIIRKTGIPTPEAVPTLDGKMLVILEGIEGGRVGLLSKELKKEQWKLSDKDEEYYVELGRILGKIHKVTRNTNGLIRHKLNEEMFFNKHIPALVWRLGKNSEESKLILSKSDYLKELFEFLCHYSPNGIIHGDFQFDNFVQIEGKTGVLDFDWAWDGPQLWDVVCFHLMIKFYLGKKGEDKINPLFLSGYAEIFPLDK